MSHFKNHARFSAVVTLAVIAAAFASSVAMAEGTGDHPCRALRKSAIEACSSAKFERGKSKEHKGLFKDCVRPVMEGKTVEGVSIDAALVKACQDRKAAHGHEKAAK